MPNPPQRPFPHNVQGFTRLIERFPCPSVEPGFRFKGSYISVRAAPSTKVLLPAKNWVSPHPLPLPAPAAPPGECPFEWPACPGTPATTPGGHRQRLPGKTECFLPADPRALPPASTSQGRERGSRRIPHLPDECPGHLTRPRAHRADLIHPSRPLGRSAAARLLYIGACR